MALLFWLLRGLLSLLVVALLVFSWRLSLIVATCLLLDFFGTVVAGFPGASTLDLALLMCGAGFALGVLFDAARGAEEPRSLAGIATVVMFALTISWVDGEEALVEQLRAPLWLLTRIFALPLGIWAGAAGLAAAKRWRQR